MVLYDYAATAPQAGVNPLSGELSLTQGATSSSSDAEAHIRERDVFDASLAAALDPSLNLGATAGAASSSSQRQPPTEATSSRERELSDADLSFTITRPQPHRLA